MQGPITGATVWGDWTEYIHCPEHLKVIGYKLRVEEEIDGDNTALNGVQLLCQGDVESLQIKGENQHKLCDVWTSRSVDSLF